MPPPPRSSAASSSWKVSFWSLTTAAVALVALSNWRDGAKPALVASSSSSSLLDRYLLVEEDNKKKNTIDDDITRDDTCRDYLMNFLNGTTDSKDECQAMYKAWQLADCADYKHGGGGGGLPALLDGSGEESGGGDGDGVFSGIFRMLLFGDDAAGISLSTGKNGTDSNATDDDVMIDDAFERWTCCGSISDFYGKSCHTEGGGSFDPYKLLGIVLVLVVCGWMKSMLKIANVRWVPDAGACIVVGAIVGGILRLARTNIVQDKILAFDNDLFLQIMLPPIVFEAAISIDKNAFRRDVFPILAFAVFGTFFSAIAIAYITYSLSNLGGTQLPWLDSLLFGALMSSIDPVATLGILSSVGVAQGDTLYTLIFGESLLNDGVSIVLFDSLVRHMGDADVVDRATVRDVLTNFLLVTLGSVGIGAACGALCTLYFYFLQTKQSAVSEVALFFAWALVPYYIADGCGLSGIISIMVMGFVLDYYVIGGHQSEDGEWMEYMQMRCNSRGDVASPSLHDPLHHPVEPSFDRFKAACCKAFSGRGLILTKSRNHVGFVAEVLSSLMETAIFAYLGLFLFNDRVWDLLMTISGLFACVSSRAVMVLLLSFIINACVWLDLESLLGRLWRQFFVRGDARPNDDDSAYSDSRGYLDLKTQMILFSAGVRGAVSYALVQNIPVYDAVTKHGSHFKGELRSMTSAAIVIVLFAFGALTYFTVQRDLSPDRERVVGSLTHRLLSMELASDDGADEDLLNSRSDLDMNVSYDNAGRRNASWRNNDSFEIEGRSNTSAPPPEGRRRGDPLLPHD